MTVREYLNQVRRIDHEIDVKQETLDRLRAMAENCSAHEITGMPKTASGRDKISEIIVKIVDLQNEINIRIDQLINLRREIIRQIEGLPNPLHRTILWSRYILNRPWEKISEKMGYSIQNCYKVHRKAVAAFGQMYRNDMMHMGKNKRVE